MTHIWENHRIYSNIHLLGSLIMIFKGVVNRSLGHTGRKIRRQVRWLGFWTTNSMTSWNNCRMPTRVMNLWQTFDNLWHVASSLPLPLQTFGTGTPRYWRRTSVGPLRWCFSNSSWNVRWFTTNVQTVEIRYGIWAWHLNLTPQVSKSLGTTCYDADAANSQGRKIQTQIKFGCLNSKCKRRQWN